ncbi:MAG: acyl carrier protein [Deltaproteobacteria bacterium]|nr:MAG: acyl carrier protein [Deltaproteobacteria bacterium]
MTNLTRDDVLQTVRRLIVEVVGDDLDMTGPIELATSFGRDLELESIEFVALAEKLQQHYGDAVDFTAWLADKDLDEIIALTVGDLVEYIAACRS